MKGLEGCWYRYLRKFFECDGAFGRVPDLHFLFEHRTQQLRGFRSPAQRQTKISGSLPDLLITRLVIQNREVFLEGGFGLSSLKIPLRFVESLGNVRHVDQVPQRFSVRTGPR